MEQMGKKNEQELRCLFTCDLCKYAWRSVCTSVFVNQCKSQECTHPRGLRVARLNKTVGVMSSRALKRRHNQRPRGPMERSCSVGGVVKGSRVTRSNKPVWVMGSRTLKRSRNQQPCGRMKRSRYKTTDGDYAVYCYVFYSLNRHVHSKENK